MPDGDTLFTGRFDAELRSQYAAGMLNERRVTIGQRGVLTIPQAIRAHATFVEGQEVRVIEATARTLVLTVEPDPLPIVAAVAAAAGAAQRFPKIAARLAAGTLERPGGRRVQDVDFDALAMDGETAGRRGARPGTSRARTGRRAIDLSSARR